MRSASRSPKHGLGGFTLIELLVVVAIIALLISILLPSLAKARAQARSAVCATRAGQLTKSMLVYADDYDGRPPFNGTGDSPDDCSDGDPEDVANVNAENWITRNQWEIANNPESDWPDAITAAGDTWSDGYVPQTGILFTYSRFENLYRCPDFEREAPGDKSQRAFNLTRSILGRKWWIPDLDPETPQELADRAQILGVMGKILPVSSIYAPSELEMVADESWKYHVGVCNGEYPRDGGAWMQSDPVWYGAQSEIGRYHGQPMMGWIAPFPEDNDPDLPVADARGAVKRGNVGYYDGHVSLVRDFLPGHSILATLMDERRIWVIEWVTSHRFFQRGRETEISAFPIPGG